jgi:hypothetical protein
MDNLQLFVLGLVVTLITAAALAPLIWAAIQDGRSNASQQRWYLQQQQRPTPTSTATATAETAHAK